MGYIDGIHVGSCGKHHDRNQPLGDGAHSIHRNRWDDDDDDDDDDDGFGITHHMLYGK